MQKSEVLICSSEMHQEVMKIDCVVVVLLKGNYKKLKLFRRT